MEVNYSINEDQKFTAFAGLTIDMVRLICYSIVAVSNCRTYIGTSRESISHPKRLYSERVKAFEYYLSVLQNTIL